MLHRQSDRLGPLAEQRKIAPVGEDAAAELAGDLVHDADLLKAQSPRLAAGARVARESTDKFIAFSKTGG